MRAAHVRPRLPIRTSVVAAILARVAEADADAAALAAELGLPEGAATEPEVVLPLSTLEQLYARAAELTGDRDFGLHLAANYPRGTYGLVEFIARNSPTLREGFARTVKYASIMNDRVRVTLSERGGAVRLEHQVVGRPLGYGRHGNEFFIPAVLMQARLLAGEPLKPTRVWFAHQAPEDVSEHVALLGTERLRFGAGSNGFELPAEQASLPIPSADPPLLSTLVAQAERALKGAPTPGSLAEQVRAVVEAKLDQTPSLQSVAAVLHMSARTLQRRLGEEDVTFAGVVDAVRERLARELVKDPAVGLSEVGFRLGYADLPAFLRAFKRWTGKTPSGLRRDVSSQSGETSHG